MVRSKTRLAVSSSLPLLCCLLMLPAAQSQDGLKTIDNPGGGRIVYGPVIGSSSLPEAMGVMLRQIHSTFGDRPEVGRYFQARGSDSIATFFALTAKRQGNTPVAGLVIVSMPSGGKPAAAVIYDKADRFSKTSSPMLKKLNEVWHPDGALPEESARGASPSSGAPTPALDPSGVVPAHTGPPQPLQTAQFPDGSGNIGLPAGWQITGGGSGTVQAKGPNGEFINLGMIVQIYDPNTQQGRQMIQFLSRQGGPQSYCIYPYGDDLIRSFTAVGTQMRQRAHLPPPDFTVIGTKRIQPGPYESESMIVLARENKPDKPGQEPLVIQMQLGVMKRAGGPAVWSMTINQIGVPTSLVDKEWATMGAVFASWRQNSGVIQQQTNVAIDNIHAIGERSKQQAADADAARIASRNAYEARSDSQSRASQNFSNYILDQAVVQNTQTGEHGTVWNQYADSLVRNAPERYQYVPQQDMMKGIDY